MGKQTPNVRQPKDTAPGKKLVMNGQKFKGNDDGENESQPMRATSELLLSLCDDFRNSQAMSLVMKDHNLQSMDGLQCLTRTRSLDLSFNHLPAVKSWQPNQLRELILASNLLESIAGVHSFASLEALDLSRNRLTTLNGLANMPKLGSLKISANQLRSLKSLGRLTSLTSIDASQNHLVSLSGMTACTALRDLIANSNCLTSLRGLSRCTDLSDVQVRPHKPDAERPSRMFSHTCNGAHLPSAAVVQCASSRSSSAASTCPLGSTWLLTRRQHAPLTHPVPYSLHTLHKEISPSLKCRWLATV
jgi:hypothetical protein